MNINIGVNLNPDENRNYGQLINFGADEFDHFVIYTSATAFINEQFDNGTAVRAIFIYADNQKVMFGLKQESHLTDDLRELLKKK